MKKIIKTTFLLIMAASALMVLKADTYKKRRPFCGFSLKGSEGKYYYEEKEQSYITREAKEGDVSGIPDVVSEIEKEIGIDAEISVYIAKNEDNCFATIGQGGKRMLIADHLFLNKVNKVAGTNWAAISIIAHEVGHHIAGFGRRNTQPEGELDADYWSGYALQKLGSSRDAAVQCILRFGTDYDTDSHPNKYKRAAAIRLGWNDASKGTFDKDRCEGCE